jgi:hypothetical protein
VQWLGRLSFVFLMLWGVVVSAQVATSYVFSQSNGTYTPISSGTLHGTAADDANYSFTLPFTFVYNGTDYTVVRPTSNGFLVLGANAPSTTNYTPLSSGSTNFAIAAFARDLNSTIRSIVLGSAPNRVYVCQWSSAYRYAVGSGESLNAQIRLYEGTNTIEIIYGTFTTTNTNTATGPMQVGLRGSSTADYNNRTTTTNWAATTAGAANSATCAGTTTVFPASGLTFTWSPPTDAVDWCNLQHPPSGSINEGGTFDVYGQAWEPGVTDAPGQAPGLNAWLGYNNMDTDPATWTNWIPATFNTQSGNNDEFVATLTGLAPGTYYYAYRYQLNGGPFRYGGYSPPPGGGFWDGTTYVSGVLTVNCSATVSSFPYLEDFETGTGNWISQSITGTEGWVRGTPSKGGITAANSGANAMVTSSLTANYGNSQTFALRSPCFDLSSFTCAPVLSFWMNMQTEAGYDAMDVEYSTNGGSTWTKLGAIASDWYNSTSTFGPISQPKFSGTSTASGWQQKSIQLPGALAGQPNVRIRLRFGSDSSTGYAGFAIDDIELKAGVADASLSNLTWPAAACSLSAKRNRDRASEQCDLPLHPGGRSLCDPRLDGCSHRQHHPEQYRPK